MASVSLPTGSGTKLGDIDYVQSSLGDKKNEENISLLFSALFNKTLPIREEKETLLQFNGFEKESSFSSSFKNSLKNQSLEKLKIIVRFFPISQSGKKEDLINNIYSFLQNPTNIDKRYKQREKKEEEKKETHQSSKMQLGQGEKDNDEDEEEEEEEDDDDEDNKTNSDEEKEESKKKSSEESGEKEGKKRRRRKSKKAEKDPDAPKRSATGWMLFLAEKRTEFINNYRSVNNSVPSISTISKELSKQFSSLPEEEKKKYLDQAKVLKDEYDKKMNEYRESGKEKEWKKNHPPPPSPEEDEKQLRKRRDKNAPKSAINAYTFYIKDNRNIVKEELEKKGMDASSVAIFQEIAKRWKELDADEKAKYEEKAKIDKERYDKEYKEYEESGRKKQFDEEEAERISKLKESKNKNKETEQKKKKKETKSQKRTRKVTLKKGVIPTEEKMKAWIEYYLASTNQVQISLREIRMTMEAECGQSLKHYKNTIEELVSQLTSENEEEEEEEEEEEGDEEDEEDEDVDEEDE